MTEEIGYHRRAAAAAHGITPPVQIPYIPAGPVGQPSKPVFSGPAKPATPELDKRSKVIEGGANLIIANFLDWLQVEGIVLARWHDEEGLDAQLVEISTDNNRLLAKHFGLDPDKIANEQEALLAYMREINNP